MNEPPVKQNNNESECEEYWPFEKLEHISFGEYSVQNLQNYLIALFLVHDTKPYKYELNFGILKKRYFGLYKDDMYALAVNV